jgi:hypothetical protein
MGTEMAKPAEQRRAKTARPPRRRPTRRARSGSARAPDAIAMLRADHARVSALFERFENARGADRREKLAEQICDELDVHMRLEEEIFYPAVRRAIGNETLMDEALVEHESGKSLIRQIRGMSPGDDLYEARVKVLGEYIRHHVKEEHTEMFPQARSSGVDLRGLAEAMRRAKKARAGSSLGILGRMLR